jgi:hypothetical protein
MGFNSAFKGLKQPFKAQWLCYVPPRSAINPLNAELNPFCHLLALLGAHHIFHVNGLRVKIKKTSYNI